MISWQWRLDRGFVVAPWSRPSGVNFYRLRAIADVKASILAATWPAKNVNDADQNTHQNTHQNARQNHL